MADITESPEWTALAEHQAALAGRNLRELFAEDPGRVERMTCRLSMQVRRSLTANRTTS